MIIRSRSFHCDR